MKNSRINKIVKESINRVLMEAENGSTCHELDMISEKLSEIMNSGFIPFASPSPSSTEQAIKDAIIGAARNIEKAKYLCEQCGYC